MNHAYFEPGATYPVPPAPRPKPTTTVGCCSDDKFHVAGAPARIGRSIHIDSLREDLMHLFPALAHPLYRLSFLLLSSALVLCAVPAHAATVAAAGFDLDDEGWTGLACPNPGVCALGSAPLTVTHLLTGGNPAGYIRTRDPSSSTAARVAPPAAFSSLMAAGQTLSFDARVERNGGDGSYGSATAPLVTIETAGGTLVFATDVLPAIDGDWQHYDVPLFDSPGWLLATTSVRPLNAGEFDTLFATRTRLTIISEWLNDSADLDTGGLDNITLSAVPLPTALPLMLGALTALGTMRGRKR